MADASKTFTPEETIGMIRAKAQDGQHGDSFIFKAFRRLGVVGGFGGHNESLVTLGGASVQQISSPEEWLPKLVGGGNFIIKIYSDQDPGKQIGGDITLKVNGEPKSIDPSILKSATWHGPPELRFPTFEPLAAHPFMSVPAQIPGGPVFPQQVTSAPTNTFVGPSAVELELKQQLQAQTQHVQAQQAAVVALQAALAEERAARREEQLRRESASQMAELRAEIAKISNAQPQKSATDSIAALVGTFMPLAQALITSSNETKLAMMKAQQDSANQFQAVLLKTMERPAVDPQITMLMDKFQAQLEKLREADPAQSSVLAQMADAFGGMMNMSMTMMQQVADSGLGGQKESMGMMIVRELAKAVDTFSRASTSAVTRRARALPPKVAPAQLAAQPAKAPVAAVATGPQTMAPPVTAPNGLAGVENPLDEIEARIRSEEDPATVAESFIIAMSDPIVQAEINAAGGTIVDVFQERLGDWANDHVEYARALLAEVEKRAVAAGYLQPEEGETVEAK